MTPSTHFWAVLSAAVEASGAWEWSSIGLEIGVDLVAVAALILYLRSLLHRRTSELHASEAQFRRLFEDAVEGIYENTSAGGFRLANPAMARIMGYSSAEELMTIPLPGTAGGVLGVANAAPGFFALLEAPRDHVTEFESEVLQAALAEK